MYDFFSLLSSSPSRSLRVSRRLSRSFKSMFDRKRGKKEKARKNTEKEEEEKTKS